MRTFIAIDLDESIKKKLSQLIHELDKVSENIKWVRREGMHLTLKFIGEVEKEKIPEIESILKKGVKNFDPFPIRLIGTGSFPEGKKKPRVLWVGIGEKKTLKELQTRIESDLEGLGFSREMREFHPHLTLGRVKTHSYLGGIFSLLERHRDTEFGGMEVTKINLFQSVLKPTGAEYRILSEFDLR